MQTAKLKEGLVESCSGYITTRIISLVFVISAFVFSTLRGDEGNITTLGILLYSSILYYIFKTGDLFSKEVKIARSPFRVLLDLFYEFGFL